MSPWQACFTALVLFACALSSAGGAEPGKKYAVLVGVEQYEHPRLREPEPLRYAVDDVAKLGEVLWQAGYEVVLLTDDTAKQDPGLAPSRANIEQHLSVVLRRCKSEDTVILAFAGHGLQFAAQKDAYFCPRDARPFADEIQTLISISSIYRELEKSFAGVKVILVDACRNDPDPGRGRGVDADSAPPPPKGVGALFSCSSGQRAFEHEDLKHGVFFHYVLEGLRSEAKDKQGEVTFEGLALYVRRRVPQRIQRLFPGREQLPNLKADLIGPPPVLISAGESTHFEKTKEIEVGKLTLTVPATWDLQEPTNRLRLGSFDIAPAEGDEAETELTIFAYGGQGGGVDANVQRWMSHHIRAAVMTLEFQEEGRKQKITRGESAQGNYVIADITGTYNMPIGPPLAMQSRSVPNARMLGAIIDMKDQGYYFLKMAGPRKTVDQNAKAFRASFGADESKEEEIGRE